MSDPRGNGTPTVTVVAPSVFLSVTVEEGTDPSGDEIHLHAGGQGVWVARMLRHLGHQPVVCVPLGGESGRAFRGLARDWEIDLDVVPTRATTPVYVHDRRSGTRDEVARSSVLRMDRHELDEFYGLVLRRALTSRVCAITGRFFGDDVPADFYRRLGSDLAAAGIPVVGDLHGVELHAFLEGGPLAWLKVSDQDLVDDGVVAADDPSEDPLLRAMACLQRQGARGVLVSRGDRPVLAQVDDRSYQIDGPVLEIVDHTGAGDSMTAALTAGLVEGLPTEAVLRRAWGAGAANVIRHGLGSARPDLVDGLAALARVVVHPATTS